MKSIVIPKSYATTGSSCFGILFMILTAYLIIRYGKRILEKICSCIKPTPEPPSAPAETKGSFELKEVKCPSYPTIESLKGTSYVNAANKLKIVN